MFTGMKRCMNQVHVVASASGKYSDRMDDLVASSSATLLAMNDRNASTPPSGARSLPRPEGTSSFRPVSCPVDVTRSPPGPGERAARGVDAVTLRDGDTSGLCSCGDRRCHLNRCIARHAVHDRVCGESGVQGTQDARLAQEHDRPAEVDRWRLSSQPPENPARSRPSRRYGSACMTRQTSWLR